MLYFLRKHAGTILIATLFFFLTPILFYGIRYGRSQSSRPSSRSAKKLNKAFIATIDGEPINRFKYSQVVSHLTKQVQAAGKDVDPYMLAAIQYNALMQTIEYHFTLKRAKQDNIKVSSREINRQIEAIAQSNKLTVKDLKNTVNTDGYGWKNFKQNIKDELTISKFFRKYENQVSITEEDIDLSLTTLRARHILISEKDPFIASKNAWEILRRAKSGENFSNLAKNYSIDTYSAKKGGDLGWFSHGTMVPEFEKAAASLLPGEIYPTPLKTQFGYHIIKLIDFKKEDLPINMDEATYRKNLLDKKKQKFIDNLIAPIRNNAEVEILSDLHLAYKFQTEGNYDKAIIKYKTLIAENPRSYIPYLFIGDLYVQQGKFEEALAAYEKAQVIQNLNPETKNSLIYIAKGNAFKYQGDLAKDKKQYNLSRSLYQKAGQQFIQASKLAKDNLSVHKQLKEIFKEIGWNKFAHKEDLEIKRIIRAQEAAKQEEKER